MYWLSAILACTVGLDEPDDVGTIPNDEPETIGEVTRAKGPVAEAPLPGGSLVTRQCLQQSRPNRSGRGIPLGYSSGGAAKSGPMNTQSAPPPPAAPASAMAEGARVPSPEKRAAEPEASRDDLARADKPTEKKDSEAQSADWGATVYLSNDDSMSLASAQRLLWAVKNGHSFQTSEVRPHELLNYFTFETTQPTGEQKFGIQAAADEAQPGTLSLAIAVQGATPPRRPLDLTVVVDVSGSMAAEGRMDYTKRGLGIMSENLVRGDRVNVVFFDNEVCTPLENYVVGRDDPSVLGTAIAQLRPRGSTNMNAGLQEGYRLALSQAESASRNHRVLLITDALLNEGEIDPNRVSEVSKGYEEKGIRLAAIGVGREFSDDVLDLLTEKGKGAYVYLGSEAVVDRVFGVGFQSLTQTIAHDVHFALDLPPSLAMERFYGEEASTNKADVQPIHYFAGTSQIFLQDLKIRNGIVKSDPIELAIEYTDAVTGQQKTERWSSTVGNLLAGDKDDLHKAQALIAWSDVLLARSMGDNACSGPAMEAFEQRIAGVNGDPEIEYVSTLTGGMCGKELHTGPKNVAFKVKLDSDMPITKLIAECGGSKTERTLTSGQSAASMDLMPGSCSLELLAGDMSTRTQVTVPEVGGEVRCTIRRGHVSCG